MVIDSSAIAAIFFHEPQEAAAIAALEAADSRLMSCATMLETAMVLEGPRATEVRVLDAFMRRFGIAPVAFDAEQYDVACDAFRRFGKGRHPAGLNLGDCFAYALAIVRDDVLLFVGDDFRKTDVRSAL